MFFRIEWNCKTKICIFVQPPNYIADMTEETEFALEVAREEMQNALVRLEKEFQKIRAGKASPVMIEGVKIDYYGVMTPIDQTANISTPDARQIIVQPWDKNVIGLIEKAILAANLGFNPKNEGDILRISVPPLTEERRKDLVKRARAEGENARISIRTIRRSANDTARQLEKKGVPEDEVDKLEADIQ
jgi:ribosome recycling factor